MKTVIRMAGGDFKPKEDDLWEGELPLVQGRLPEFRVALTDDDGENTKVLKVTQVCLELCNDWTRQILFVLPS
jgi:hypothetical protein